MQTNRKESLEVEVPSSTFSSNNLSICANTARRAGPPVSWRMIG
jgi:hypothetical protein